MSTLKTNTLKDTAGGNSMPLADINQGRAKAWAQMDGTGTVAFRDAYNFGSITDSGVGRYLLGFIVNRPSANYSAVMAANANASPANGAITDTVVYDTMTNGFRVGTDTLAGAAVDPGLIMLTVDGDPA